jgi:hypothetical protein
MRTNHLLLPSRIIAVLLAAAVLSGCASGPNVIANRAPDFELANYRTFGFMEPLSTDRDGVRTLLSNRLVDATTRELERKGLAYSAEQPDLLVNFVVSTRETLSSRPSSSVNVGFRTGRYNTWGGYSVGVGTSTADVVQQTEGTLVIDIVDAGSNTLVWEGALSGRVTDKVRRNLEPAIDKAVVDILSEFP